ncbi:MAG: hypothetical protein BRC41_04295 [Cyanobacteria bacterium QH_9_48_43]|nr:MAG: hypothetical protein BRC41_04295 [Cyanobacteria bacterium QH_9_48_43]
MNAEEQGVGEKDAETQGDKEQGSTRSRRGRRRGDTGTRGRGELRDTQISAPRSQGLEGTSNPLSLSPRHTLSASVPKGLSAPGHLGTSAQNTSSLLTRIAFNL